MLVRLPKLKRFFPPMCYPVGDVDRADYHPYSYHRPLPSGELESLLEGAGFEIVLMKRIMFVWKNVSDPLFPVCRSFERILESMPLLRNLGSTLVVHARKRT
jgi:hypothetical protein